MKTLKSFEAVKDGTVVAWIVYYNDDDSLCCITHDKYKADAYKLMSYTVKELKK